MFLPFEPDKDPRIQAARLSIEALGAQGFRGGYVIGMRVIYINSI